MEEIQYKLKPCPFCGGKASFDEDGARRGTQKQSMIIVCLDCGCRLETSEVYGRHVNLAWNDRTEDEAGNRMRKLIEMMPQDLVDKLNSLIDQ